MKPNHLDLFYPLTSAAEGHGRRRKRRTEHVNEKEKKRREITHNERKREKEKEKKRSTGPSRVVPHRSTTPARTCLTSLFGWEAVSQADMAALSV